MNIFQRRVNLFEFPSKTVRFVLLSGRGFYLFKKPLSLLYHYIKSASPPNRSIELRNGLKIFLSSHKHDLSTVVVVFCKKDYGDIQKDSIVIDIGANIGIFSLYAACMGAKNVYAFEPNKEAYECLLKNVHENGLGNIIIPCKLAIANNDNDIVRIPLSSSPYNRTLRYVKGEHYEQSELVRTISLTSILKRHSIDRVDLLKIDCEGAEYDIIPATKSSVFSNIKKIRMEYHRGNLSQLVTYLEKCNFEVTRFRPGSPHCGDIWFSQ